MGESNWVPLDMLSKQEMYIVVRKAASAMITDAAVRAITDALIAQQGGFDHMLAQAAERGWADHQAVAAYPWIKSHAVNPYTLEPYVSACETAVDSIEQST